MFGHGCPAFLSLIDLVLSLPAMSSEAERVFSCLKMVKTSQRSSLTDQLMVILECPEIKDFQPQDAIDLWVAGGCSARRPG